MKYPQKAGRNFFLVLADAQDNDPKAKSLFIEMLKLKQDGYAYRNRA